jgi:hypothetical protein
MDGGILKAVTGLLQMLWDFARILWKSRTEILMIDLTNGNSDPSALALIKTVILSFSSSSWATTIAYFMHYRQLSPAQPHTAEKLTEFHSTALLI